VTKKGAEIMKKVILIIASLLISSSWVLGAAKEFDIHGKTIISKNPPFSFTLPSELQWAHASSSEHPAENSLTRAAIFIREKKKQVEEMLIIQIAERTNPQAGPMMVPPLKPYDERRIFIKGKIKKGDVEVEYLNQLMTWNPDAPGLQPLVKKGLTVPAHWALQCQFLFQPQLDQAILIRYSRDIDSFGLKVSHGGKSWDKESIAANEKKVFEAFQKMASETVNSLRFQTP
jgi:hypothetical protein